MNDFNNVFSYGKSFMKYCSVLAGLLLLDWCHSEIRGGKDSCSNSSEMTSSVAGQSQGRYYKEESAVAVE